MIEYLISHQWKSATRSKIFYRSLGVKVFAGVMGLLAGLNILGLGLMLKSVLDEVAPSQNPVEVVNGILLYYFLADLLLRAFLQRLPVQLITPYLPLPISRNRLFSWVLVKSLLSTFNILPLLFFVPAAVVVIYPGAGLAASLTWVAVIVFLLLSGTYLTFFVQAWLQSRLTALLGYCLLLAVPLGLDLAGLTSLVSISRRAFGWASGNPLFVLLPLLAAALFFWMNLRALKARTYLDRIAPQRSGSAAFEFPVLDRFGEVGRLLALEIRMIVRNRRPRGSVYFALCTPIFGALFYLMIPFDEEYYPVPTAQTIEQLAREQDSLNEMAGATKVTFRVRALNLPEASHVYLAGRGERFGEWNPAGLPLLRRSDGTWERTLLVEEGESLRYRLTLGSWETQRLTPEGEEPESWEQPVTHDGQVIELLAERWTDPRRPLVVDINLIYIGLMMSGMMMLAYGQMLIGWESSFFDTILTRTSSFIDYFKAKFILLSFGTILLYILCLPLGFISLYLVYFNSALLLYNLGINTFLVMVMATMCRKRVDLAGEVLGFQGKGASQFLLMVPTLIVPTVIGLSVRAAGYPDLMPVVLGGLGVVGLIFHRFLLRAVVALFERQKYSMAVAFRQRD